MKLANIGPGEISDRLSILSLKILFGTEAGKDVGHFQTEQTVLLSQIRSRTLNGKWFAAYSDLAAVNAALWHAEDVMRTWRKEPEGLGNIDNYDDAAVDEIARCAFRIQALNDRRAALVQQINEEAGESTGVEKL